MRAERWAFLASSNIRMKTAKGSESTGAMRRSSRDITPGRQHRALQHLTIRRRMLRVGSSTCALSASCQKKRPEPALRASCPEHAADARVRAEGDGRQHARRARLSDVGLSATPDRRPQHAASQQQSAPVALTGFPAITVPMGFVRDGLLVGLQVFGRAWSEPTLIKIVYGYEQASRHRRPPASTPPLPARP